MSIPQPGKPVRGSHSGSPLMAVFDLLGRRWAMGIVWNLKEGGMTFRSLQEKCGSISPSILNSRLKDLREAGIIERSLEGYELTERGKKLRDALDPIGKWSLEWAADLFQYHKKC